MIDFKRDEEKRFLLISDAPGFAEHPEMIDHYSEEILLNINEEERKRITKIRSLLRSIIGYKDSPRKRYLVSLFGEFYDSFGDLKRKLKEGGLEKTSASIRMIPHNKSKFGIIRYSKSKGGEGIFGYYKTIQ